MWISLVRECNVFLQCCITLGPARQFSLQNVKLSRIVTYRSKIIRVNCSLNWSYINLLWRIELWLSKLQLSVFLKIVWVFWLERVVPPLVIALNKLNSLWTVLFLPQLLIIQGTLAVVLMVSRPLTKRLHCAWLENDPVEFVQTKFFRWLLGVNKCVQIGGRPFPNANEDKVQSD